MSGWYSPDFSAEGGGECISGPVLDELSQRRPIGLTGPRPDQSGKQEPLKGLVDRALTQAERRPQLAERRPGRVPTHRERDGDDQIHGSEGVLFHHHGWPPVPYIASLFAIRE